MRTKSKRTIRPSGVEQTDSMFYWKCSVSGLVMFAVPERFAEVVKNFGGEDNLVKNYVLRPVKKYVDAGYTADQIKAIIEKNDGKLPPLDALPAAAISKFEKRDIQVAVSEPKSEIVQFKPAPIEQPKEREIVIYPWSGNPDYFKSPPSPIVIGDETKSSCIYPNRNLEDQCVGCSVYDQCNCSAKYSPEDQKKPKRNEIKIKAIVVAA